MSAKTCPIQNCERQQKAGGYCLKHYTFLKRHTDNPEMPFYERHGLSRSPEYRSWREIKSRTTNPNRIGWKTYGAKGIKTCSGLSSSFNHFYKILGERPGKYFSVDRIDNNGGYWCGECSECLINLHKLNIRWANPTTQAINKGMRSDNTSGHTGVFWYSPTKTWIALITVNKKRIRLGTFRDKLEAINARQQAEHKYWGNI